MPDPDPIPVIQKTKPPVLSYANLRGQQPGDSRFVCELLPDGVRLTEPPLPNAGRVDRWLGLMILALEVPLAIYLMVVVLEDSHRQANDWARAIGVPLILILGGAGLYAQGVARRNQETVLEIRDGYLRASTPAILRRQYLWKVTEGLAVVTSSTPGFVQQRNRFGLIAAVIVQPARSKRYPILENRPKDECEWVVRELMAAIETSLASENSSNIKS